MQLDFPSGGNLNQAFLYSITKGYEKNKKIPFLKLNEAMYGKCEDKETRDLYYATIIGTTAFLGSFKDMNLDFKTDDLIINKLPDGFVDYIERNARIILEGEKGEAKNALQSIDSMFAQQPANTT
jgi:hypothetical protein